MRRTPRILLAALGCAALSMPISPAEAAGTAEAKTYGVVAPDGGVARVVLACVGEGSAGAAFTQVTCDIYDSSGNPSIHRVKTMSGGECACIINAFNLVMPIRYCSRVKVTFSDLTTAEDTSCKSYGEPVPPENPPTQYDYSVIGPFAECSDPAGLDATVNDIEEALGIEDELGDD